ADRRREMAGVAPARAEAAELLLEQHDVEASLTQRERRRHAGIATADDDHVRAHVGRQRWRELCRLREPGTQLQDRGSRRHCRCLPRRRSASNANSASATGIAPPRSSAWAPEAPDVSGRASTTTGRSSLVLASTTLL